MELLRQGQQQAAAQAFTEATEHDPTAADAWLGLHSTGTLQAQALDAMVVNSGSFGALRSKFSTPLRSNFQIGHYVTFRLENARDLWLAAMTALLDAGQLDEAWAALCTAQLDCDETRFVCARHAFLKEEWPSVLTFARGIQEPFLRDEAQFCIGAALFAQGVYHEALNVLGPLPQKLEVGSRFDGEVAYFRGRCLESLGDTEAALKQYQYAFRCAPGIHDVDVRAQVRRTSPVPSDGPAAPVAPGTAPAPSAPASAAPGGGRNGQSGQHGQSDQCAPDPATLLAEAQEALDAMIGLEPVKRQVQTLIAQLRMAAVREEQGLPSSARPRHFVFAGPPGTGKTTVARIVGKVFAGLGLLEKGHVIEAQRVDLVGQHLGSTAIKTSGVIDSAMDGVLFVDEAYALSNSGYSGGDAFGDEALQVLLKRAEDDRDRLVVVLAGYRDEMAGLLATNPGLASRFTTRVDFPSYDWEQLLLIARSVLAAQGDAPSDEAAEALGQAFRTAAERELTDTLGNGRFARELCLKATALRDLRLLPAHAAGTLTREDIVTVLPEDVNAAYQELMEPHDGPS
ncbi:AAA family ATPase [Streptomyces sp. NPDC090053]|uniref:AAA family ATPase n=1 Tax=Streptomyces sp. NPDC090053 TaxID=3365932 RepID=UPI0038300E30